MTTYRPPFVPLSRRAFMQGSAAVGISLVTGSAAGWSAENGLNIYNWDTYIGETTLDSFAAASGIRPRYDLFADNEELFAKLKSGNPGYDLIFPSDYMVEIMITTGIITPLDHGLIPNLNNLNKNFTNSSFDPNMKHSVPYMWGTQGFGYRKSKYPNAPKSWSAVFDDATIGAHSGKIAMLSDVRAVLGGALKYMGHSLNSVDGKQIAAAADLVLAAKKHYKTFAEDNGQDLLLTREVDLAMEWNGDVVQVMSEDDDLSYLVPDEGAVVWMDNMCIPKDAPNPKNAHAFINHVLDAKVNAEIANTIHYASPNLAAKPLLLPEDLNNPAVYPPDSVIARCEAVVDVGDATRLYDEAWTRVQAG
ncbi:MAG: spermidine/putrescine ABC transporter substrate-binding protein [Rhodospirillaceae bacterium]